MSEWVREWVALAETRETMCVSDCRRSLAAARETMGPTAFQELVGRELTDLEEERQRWESQLWAAVRQLRNSKAPTEGIVEFRKIQKEDYLQPSKFFFHLPED